MLLSNVVCTIKELLLVVVVCAVETGGAATAVAGFREAALRLLWWPLVSSFKVGTQSTVSCSNLEILIALRPNTTQLLAVKCCHHQHVNTN